MDINYQIVALEKERFAEAVDFTCAAFVRGSVLHRALDIPVADYITYSKPSLYLVLEEGLSFVAIDVKTDSIIASILAGDYHSALAPNVDRPDFMRPIDALLDQLRHSYIADRVITKGTALLVDMAVVSAAARGLGIYSNLRQAVHAQGRDMGYEIVLGELSSAYTQSYCVGTLGHTVVNQIAYSEFEYDGTIPFLSIDNPPCIQLVEGMLN